MSKPEIFKHQCGGWEFEVVKGNKIIETSIRGDIKKKLEIFSLPDMIFETRVMLKNKDFEIVLHPLDSIPFCFYDVQQKVGIEKLDAFPAKEWSKHQDGTFVNFEGKKEKMQNREEKIDWTFTCLYNGTLKNAKNVEKTEEEIDYKHLLDKSFDIKYFAETILFEDELSDFGISKLISKIRVNEKSFFLLLKNVVLVSKVAIRVIDHRFFGWFGKDYLIRESSHREMGFEEFKSSFPWIEKVTLDKILQVSNEIKVKRKFNEKITF